MCWLRKQLSVAYYFLFGRIWTMNKWTTTTRSSKYIHSQWETSSLEKRLRVHIIPWITFFLLFVCRIFSLFFLKLFLFHFAIIIFSLLYLFWVSSKTIMTFFTFSKDEEQQRKCFASKIADRLCLNDILLIILYFFIRSFKSS